MHVIETGYYELSPHAVGPIITGLLALAFGLMVAAEERLSKTGVAFLAMTASAAVALLAVAAQLSAPSDAQGLFWAKVSVFATGCVGVAVYHYSVGVLGIFAKRRLLVLGSGMVLLLFGVLLALTPWVVEGLWHHWWGRYPKMGILGPVFHGFIVSLLALSLIEFWRQSRASDSSINRRRLQWLMGAFAVGSLGIVDFLAAYGVPLYAFGYLAVFGFVAIVAMTVRRYRLVDITPAFAAQRILSTMVDPLVICDGEDRIQIVNEALCSTFGYTKLELVGQPLDILESPHREDSAPSEERRQSSDQSLETAFYTKSGEAVAVSISLSRIKHRGMHLGSVIVARDIRERQRSQQALRAANDQLEKRVEDRTAELKIAIAALQAEIRERERLEEALRESEERYALATQGANDGLWDWDLRTDAIYLSPRWKAILGHGEEGIGNRLAEWFDRVHPNDIEKLQRAISAHKDGATAHFESMHRILHRDGGYRWMLTRGLATRDSKGVAYRMAGSQSDITERKRFEEQLLHDAFHDALTALPNRELFVDRLGRAIQRAGRRRDYIFAVLYLDLDRFKDINDSLGPIVGDQLIIAAAARLQACLRASDTVARLGGDEFAILLDDIDRPEMADQVAQRIQKQFAEPFVLQQDTVFTSASMGLVRGSTDYSKPDNLLRDADIAMYRAKSLGKNRVEVFDASMRDEAMGKQQLESDLRHALERGQLELYYQPIVSLRSGTIRSFEALIRWRHPERGLIPPLEFIPLAEETGLIVPIGLWVLREACEQIRSWREELGDHAELTVSVNVSSKQVADPDLVASVQEVLKATGVRPETLHVEITESVIMDNVASTRARLEQLRELGVGICIDDFGTGYSSLSYLQSFPFDIIKIDRTFVSRIGCDEPSDAIIRAIIMLADGLHMGVIAEGVETESQLNALRAVDCKWGQGYLFAKPLDHAGAGALLATSGRGDAALL